MRALANIGYDDDADFSPQDAQVFFKEAATAWPDTNTYSHKHIYIIGRVLKYGKIIFDYGRLRRVITESIYQLEKVIASVNFDVTQFYLTTSEEALVRVANTVRAVEATTA